jgi:L-seryl-tRNA(Sec) kinase
MRYEFYQLAADYSSGYLQIFIDCSVEDACQSNKSRPVEMQVPDDVIQKMKAKLEIPRENWENTLKIDRSDGDKDDILEVIRNRILAAVKEPVLTKKLAEEMKAISEADRAINRKNVVHNADQILRKLVSETVQERRNENVDIRLLAKNLNEHRHKFMMDMKRDDFSIPQNLTGQNGSVDIQLLHEWIAPKFLASFQDAHNMLES